MQPNMADEVTDALDEPIPLCPTLRWVNRPRLWWTWWTAGNSNDPDDKPLQWTKQGRWQRLRLEAASSFDLDGLAFPERVASGQLYNASSGRQWTRAGWRILASLPRGTIGGRP